MILPIGPIHPYLKEPIRLKLQTEGERVVKAEIEYGYVHRGIEKIIEGKTWQKVFIWLKEFAEYVLMNILNHLQKLLRESPEFMHLKSSVFKGYYK